MVKSKLSKLALVAAGGAVALATAAGPALAEPPAPVADLGKQQQVQQEAEAAPRNPEIAPNTMDLGRYLGRVVARNGLNVRVHPNTYSRVIATLPYGRIVHIECKVRGQNVAGNNLWYKLDRHHHRHDGWVSARYVTNIGPAPHFCHSR